MKEIVPVTSTTRPIEAFLRQLQQELTIDLTPAQVEAVLIETEAHLRDRAEALIELGSPRQMAEADSVEAFGDAKRYAAAIVEAAGPSPERLLLPVRRLAALACAAAGTAVIFERTWHNPITYFLPTIFLFGLVATSFRACRWDIKGVFRVALAASLATWIAMSVAWIREPNTGPYEVMGRADIPRRISDAGEWAKALEAETERMNTASAMFQTPGVDPLTVAATLGLRCGDEILVPSSLSKDQYIWISEVRYEPASVAVAVERWRRDGANMVAGVRSSAQRWRDWEEELRRVSSRSYFVDLLQLWPWPAISLPFAFIPLFLCHTLGVIAALVARAGRRSRRRMGSV